MLKTGVLGLCLMMIGGMAVAKKPPNIITNNPTPLISCPVAQYSLMLLNDAMLARGYTWFQFKQKYANNIVAIYNANSPKTNITPDTVGMFYQKNYPEGMLVLAKGGCIIDTNVMDNTEFDSFYHGDG